MTSVEFFNRYRYDLRKDKLGGGSFGTVYKAYDHVLDRYVAIKVSEVKNIGGKEFSLNDEFKAIANIRHHANIAFYEDVFTFESPQGIFDYAIMQFYKDGNLSEFMQANPQLDFAKRSEIILQIMNGLEHLHQNGLVHRDLKPGNIMVVARQNGEIVPKITDFGLSKTIDNQASRFQSSFAGGTIQYSSPEQIKGEEYKRNTDWWSFGVIAYEIFTGAKLFDVIGVSSVSIEWQNQVSEQILKADFTEKLNEISDENWRAVLSACLEKDKAKRVQSATEIKLLLDQSHQPEQATQVAGSLKTDIHTVVKNTVKDNPTKVQATRVMSSKSKPVSKSNKSSYMFASIGALLFFIASGFVFYYFFIKKETPSDTISLYEENNLYGYKKGDEVLIKAYFEKAEEFNEGQAKVTKGDSVFLIDEEGNWLRTLEKTNPEPEPEPNPDPDPSPKPKPKPKPNPNPDSKPSLAEVKIKGLALYNAQKDSEAYPLLLQCAQVGDAECQHATAFILKSGTTGVPKNTQAAFEWYTKAANQGLAKSMYNLASFYDGSVKGFPIDYKKAADMLLESAKLGYEMAMRRYADMKYYANYNMIDYAQALYWYEQFFKLNKSNGNVNYNLGDFYFFGKGVAKNYEKAYNYYSLAVEKNNLANGALGDMYSEGAFVQQNYQIANQFYEKGCTAKDNYACFKLGNAYYYGRGIQTNYSNAAFYWEKAAELGNSAAAYNLGAIIYLDGKSGTPNREKAIFWLKKAAQGGDIKAKSKLNSLGESW
jgi:serine/threonine protein kinase